MIIGIAGRINSGKTTVAQELSKKLNCKVTSFGNVVRKIATERNIGNDRKSLQDLGQSLVDNELDYLCKGVLDIVHWDAKENIIIEGIRHKNVLIKLKSITSPFVLKLIYIDASNSLLDYRDNSSRIVNNRAEIEKHETEREVISDIKAEANIIVNAEESMEVVCDKILQLLLPLC